MSRLTKMTLTDAQRADLEAGYKQGKTHGFRQRCHMILLKAQHKTSQDIGQLLGCHFITVNLWVKRYQTQGIQGLHTKQGRGRKAILQEETDLSAVRLAVQTHRKRLRQAQETLQEELGKQFSRSTLKRFLKKTVADSNEYDVVPKANRTKTNMPLR